MFIIHNYIVALHTRVLESWKQVSHHHHHNRFKSVLPVDNKIQFSRVCTCLHASDLPPNRRFCGIGTLGRMPFLTPPKPAYDQLKNKLFLQSTSHSVPWEINVSERLPVPFSHNPFTAFYSMQAHRRYYSQVSPTPGCNC